MLLPILSLLLLKLPESQHLFRRLVYYRGQIHLLLLVLLFQHWKFLHYLVILMPFLDKVVSVSPEEAVYLLMRAGVPS